MIRGRLILLLFIILVMILLPSAMAEVLFEDIGESSESDSLFEDVGEEAEEETTSTQPEPSQDNLVQEDEYEYYDYSQEYDTDYISIDEVSQDSNIKTSQGTISQFSMTNALFSLGSLVQGSFISFENNNAIFFKSIFDASEFTATLDEESQLQIAQRNSFGDTGSVYITIDKGNLTQDEEITFIPDGDSPTYIYYNTTVIEFEDGTITLLGESITNLDSTKDKTSIEFNSEGFTKLQLHPDNIYTTFDYEITNTGTDSLIICKDDPLCDINIVDSIFSLKGELNFIEQEETIYESLDPNNKATIDINTGSMILTNPKPRNEILSYIYTGNHIITQTQDITYDLPTPTTSSSLITSYTINDKTITITNNNLNFENFNAYSTQPKDTNTITARAVQQPLSRTKNLGYGLVMLGILTIFSFYLENKVKKKGQMSIFIITGLLIIIIIIVILVSALNPDSTKSLAQIESLDQASSAVEDCLDDYILDSFLLQMNNGGHINGREDYSTFGTLYELKSIEDMESYLTDYLNNNINSCSEILENTDYEFELNDYNIEIDYAEEIIINIDSLGRVSKIDISKMISDRTLNLDTNFLEMYSIMETIMSSEYGTPIESYDNYNISTYVNEDYTEQLIVIENQDLTFRLTKLL